MAPKRGEIACRFQLTNYAQCDGLLRVSHSIPNSTPSSQIGGTVPPLKICFAIGSLKERASVSVPANKFDLIRRTFTGCHTPSSSLAPPPKLGGGGRSPHSKFVLRLAR